MKYKLLKDTPTIKAGMQGKKESNDFYSFETRAEVSYFERIPTQIVESSPDWFEPVIERWTANNEQYYWVNSTLNIESYSDDRSPTDRFHHASGNYSRTKDQAEEASKRIKKCLMEYHKELGE